MAQLWAALMAYPAPRARAVTAPAGGGPAPLALPSTRAWSIALATGGPSLRCTGVSPKIVGPAIIRDFTWWQGTRDLSATKNFGLELYYSKDNSGAGTGQTIDAKPSGTPIFESWGDPTQDDKFQTLNSLVASGPLSSAAQGNTFDLHYLLPGGEWFIKASLMSSADAVVVDVGITLAIIENIDPDLIPDLL